MPIRNNRWVSWAQLLSEQEAAKAAEPAPPPVEASAATPRATTTRRSRRAAAAAIKDATGVELELAIEDSGNGEPSA